MGSVGPSLDSGAVVGAEVCAAVDVEEEGEGRMSLMRVGLGLAGIAGGRAWFRGEGWRGRIGSLGPYAVVRWFLRARCLYGRGFLLEAGKFRIVGYLAGQSAYNCYNCKEVGAQRARGGVKPPPAS